MIEDSFMSVVDDPNSAYSVLFEDDGKVAYAYLRDGTKVVGDVWIYNCGPAPETAEWTLPDARSRMPFANPAGYAVDELPPDIHEPSDVSCRWTHDGEGLAFVEVLLNGVVFARLQPGSSPGWSRLARRDGPNAKVLTSLDDEGTT